MHTLRSRDHGITKIWNAEAPIVAGVRAGTVGVGARPVRAFGRVTDDGLVARAGSARFAHSARPRIAVLARHGPRSEPSGVADHEMYRNHFLLWTTAEPSLEPIDDLGCPELPPVLLGKCPLHRCDDIG